jgi:hypothetical protein
LATYTPKEFFQIQPGTAETTQYTVPAATSAILREIVVANVTGSPVTFEFSKVASGGTAGAANRLIPAVSIPALTTVSFTYEEVMATGGFMSTKAGTAAALTVTCSGVTFV